MYCICVWLYRGLAAAHGLSLVAASGDCSLVTVLQTAPCEGFSLQSTNSRALGLQ